MKIQCACGSKYEFDITPEMAGGPVRFICPACGFDSSEFVNNLVRQELGQAGTPAGAPVTLPMAAAAPAGVLLDSPPPPSARPAVRVRVHTPEPVQQEDAPAEAGAPQPCLKHPGEFAVEKCYICSKPLCPKCMELFGYVCSPLCKAKADSHGITIPVYESQKSVVEARQWRNVVRVSVTAGLLIVALLGAWIWYAWFGCLPKPVFSVRFPTPSYSGQSVICGKQKDQIVFLHGDTLARHDLKLKKEIWSCRLIDSQQIAEKVDQAIQSMQKLNDKLNNEGHDPIKIPPPEKLRARMERAAAEELVLHVRGENIWIASPGKLVRYDWETGKPAKELAVKAGYGGLIARGDELMMVNTDSGKPLITHINLASCESRTEELGGPASAGKAGSVATARGPRAAEMAGLPIGMPGKDMDKPMDPAKVAEQAQHLSLPAKIALPAVLSSNMRQERALAELNDELRKRSVADGDSDASSSRSLIPTEDGFVQFSVRLIESRIVERSAMKAAPSKSVLDGPVTASQSLEAANEILNEMQRSRGGDIVREDMSRYQVSLGRPAEEACWTGEVIGPPKLYPLQSVNVLAANKTIIVLDKSNKKLWQSALTFNVEGDLGALEEENATYGQGPCVERKGMLYVFDEGVLSAFDLKTGSRRWTVPSVGITGLFFDDQDMIYVNTTTASRESLKYSRQIDVSQKVSSVVMKVDAKDGKVLWNVQPGGLVNYVSGKFIYIVQSYMPPEPDEDNPYVVETGFETPPYLRIRRINPKNGNQIWEHFQQRAPLDIAFDKNTIRLVFKKEVQVLRSLTF